MIEIIMKCNQFTEDADNYCISHTFVPTIAITEEDKVLLLERSKWEKHFRFHYGKYNFFCENLSHRVNDANLYFDCYKIIRR